MRKRSEQVLAVLNFPFKPRSIAPRIAHRPSLQRVRTFDVSLHNLLSLPREIPLGLVLAESDAFTLSNEVIALRYDF